MKSRLEFGALFSLASQIYLFETCQQLSILNIIFFTFEYEIGSYKQKKNTHIEAGFM